MTAGPEVYQVHTHDGRRKVSGSDACIITIPSNVFVTLSGDRPAVDLEALGHVLRHVSHDQAVAMGEILHHADWVITSEPAVIEEWGICQSKCDGCRVAVDKVLLDLIVNPQQLLVGRLYWAER